MEDETERLLSGRNREQLLAALAEMEPRSLAAVVAQLRHAYEHLAAGRVVNQREFAEGLIAPQIRALEAMLPRGSKT